MRRRRYQPRFRVDQAGLDEACDLIGLRLPARVVRRRMKHWGGRYVGVRGHHHQISVSRDLGIAAAQYVILHELAHALQAERVAMERCVDNADHRPAGACARADGWAYAEFLRRWLAQVIEAGVSKRDLDARGAYDPELKRLYDGVPFEQEANEIAFRFDRRVTVCLPDRPLVNL